MGHFWHFSDAGWDMINFDWFSSADLNAPFFASLIFNQLIFILPLISYNESEMANFPSNEQKNFPHSWFDGRSDYFSLLPFLFLMKISINWEIF